MNSVGGKPVETVIDYNSVIYGKIFEDLNDAIFNRVKVILGAYYVFGNHGK